MPSILEPTSFSDVQEAGPPAKQRKKARLQSVGEDPHEFFANGMLVHNCDGLTYLLQGLANQGLELPRFTGSRREATAAE
jgi:hypothetical protein